jgi:hypothetical protein
MPTTTLSVAPEESDFYHAGDSISWWLSQKSNNPVTQHKKTEILNGLTAGIYSAQTRMDIGDCENTPVEVLLMLAADEDPDVRFALAENHNIHESVLNMLAEDSHPYIAHRGQKTLARLKGPAMVMETRCPMLLVSRGAHPRMRWEGI